MTACPKDFAAGSAGRDAQYRTGNGKRTERILYWLRCEDAFQRSTL